MIDFDRMVKSSSFTMHEFIFMENWSVDVKELKKDKEKYAVWRLEQVGLGGQKLDGRELKKYWPKLRLDPRKKSIWRCFWESGNSEIMTIDCGKNRFEPKSNKAP